MVGDYMPTFTDCARRAGRWVYQHRHEVALIAGLATIVAAGVAAALQKPEDPNVLEECLKMASTEHGWNLSRHEDLTVAMGYCGHPIN